MLIILATCQFVFKGILIECIKCQQEFNHRTDKIYYHNKIDLVSHCLLCEMKKRCLSNRPSKI